MGRWYADASLTGKSGASVTRHFFLFNDILVYTQEKRKMYIYKGSINLFPPKYNLCVQDVPSSTCLLAC